MTSQPRRILIASSHALFGQGLRSLIIERYGKYVEIVGMVSNIKETIEAIEKLQPDLVIVDYDDQALNRDEFLAHFVEGEMKLRVVLLSLQSAGSAIVYDRRTLAGSQIDDWLEEWTYGYETSNSFADLENVDSKEPNRRTSMKHLIIAGILVVVVAALLILGLGQVRLLPIEASAQAKPIDALFSLHFTIIAILFALIIVFMVYSIIVFRRKPGDTTDAAHIEGNSRLEVAWTIAPLITVLALAYVGGGALADTLRADPRALEVNVIGQQWSWRFEYPEYDIVSNELVLPINKQAILHLSSLDVIHSFWVPEFRVKQDALPGGEDFIRDLRVTPTLLGDYKVRCAELCGLQHTTMIAPVRVVSEEEFNAWIAEQSGGLEDPIQRGQKVAQDYGCLACHSLDGSVLVGPSWKGIFGTQETMTDGTVLTIDEAYLKQSIVDPSALIVTGFQNVMPPTYADQLSDEQIADLIEFIKSLK